MGKKNKLVSIPRDKVLTVATNRSVPAGTFQREGPQDVMWQKIRAHIGILGINTSCRHDASLLLILIEGERVGIEGTLDDVETSLVGDTIAVTEGGRTGVVCTGHIMDRDEVG